MSVGRQVIEGLGFKGLGLGSDTAMWVVGKEFIEGCKVPGDRLPTAGCPELCRLPAAEGSRNVDTRPPCTCSIIVQEMSAFRKCGHSPTLHVQG